MSTIDRDKSQDSISKHDVIVDYNKAIEVSIINRV